jgi:hypothetical protein
MCESHYKKWRKNVDLDAWPIPTLTERLWQKIRRTPDGCWEWTGAMSRATGYGKATMNGRSDGAHRIMYELIVGPIPTGLDLDHLCRNRICVNPAHLEPVTRSENVRRGIGGVANFGGKNRWTA